MRVCSSRRKIEWTCSNHRNGPSPVSRSVCTVSEQPPDAAGLDETTQMGRPKPADVKGKRSMPDSQEGNSDGSIDERHLLLVGAGPGLGMAIARRFAVEGYGVTLVARSTDGLRALADSLSDTGTMIDTIAADASDPEGLGERVSVLYRGRGARGLIMYNAVMGAPDGLLSSSVAHLLEACTRSTWWVPSSSHRSPP